MAAIEHQMKIGFAPLVRHFSFFRRVFFLSFFRNTFAEERQQAANKGS